MDNFTLAKKLCDLKPGEAGECIRNLIKQTIHQSILNILSEEVGSLCGPKHEQGAMREFYRSGSTPGSYDHNGSRERIKKPRVRRKKANGTSEEVSLESYEGVQDSSTLEDSILMMLTHGVSSRDVGTVLKGSPSTSKSNVSRLLAAEGARQLETFRSRDLSQYEFIALTLDGIFLSSSLCVITALGIDVNGNKVILDFEVGSSENKEVSCALLARICNRGFQAPSGLFCALDGSKALVSAVLKYFPKAVIQRCLIHKERNIKGCLSKKHWGELSRLFRALRRCQGKGAGEEKLNDLKMFLETKNKAAYESLLEADEDLIALHKLNVPSTLNPSLLNTNIIENSFRNVRNKIGRVTRWREETNQPSNWMALAINHIEKGFRKIKGYQDLNELKRALEHNENGKK